MPAEGFSIPLFAEQVRNYIETKELKDVIVVGYSMGGYVAMYLAVHFPERIAKVITLATKFRWTEAIALKEMQQLDGDKIQQKIPAFADVLKERHAPNNWLNVLTKTVSMLKALGENSALSLADYKTITQPCLLLLGDRDKMISIDETTEVYSALPNGAMAMLPNTPHPIEQVNREVLIFLIRNFVS